MCWHKWSKWKLISQGTLKEKYDNLTGRMLEPKEEFVSGYFMEQSRECDKCGAIQLRRAKC